MPPTILEPGQSEPAPGTFATLRLPAPGLFAARARRLVALAPGHPLAMALRFAARLARGQEDLWAGLTPPDLPSAAALAACRGAAMPPLAAPGWWPAPAWRDLVRRLAAGLAPAAPDPSRLTGFTRAADDWLEGQARALLAGEGDGLDLAAAPLIGAVLQVAWTAAAARLSPEDLAPPGIGPPRPGQCPVCGAPPVAAVLRTGGAEEGLRYLHCGLCASEWHVVRAKCALCDNTGGIVYLSLEDAEAGADPAAAPRAPVQAEACPACRAYLKLVRLERDPGLDPWADDLATLALDLLVEQEGFERAGLNFLLLQAGDGCGNGVAGGGTAGT